MFASRRARSPLGLCVKLKCKDTGKSAHTVWYGEVEQTALNAVVEAKSPGASSYEKTQVSGVDWQDSKGGDNAAQEL
ncbi:uncharacterized protein N7483_011385 [Penicillium malachiteum]|uniref:uncharacterized protein n=1 Tax=Penicillium malachiteum TaxID=1324776 RepID=UPI00254680A5|nr:uncharacterized protein N7483_011385 [Penicillium malachiteum]KAJ5714204.1 hypothetical protein N7483_011385 [Penicillium malachiteum]